jgi:hypothetical protein
VIRRLAVGLCLLAAGIVLPAAGVAGDPPTTLGWWTATNPGGPVPTVVPSRQTRADVPAGGFEVATGPDQVSYGAVAYSGPEGVQVQGLVLKLAPGAAQVSDSKVQACPLTTASAFAQADGAPLADGPKYDCSAPAPGVEDTAATTVTFDVARFARGTQLGVAIVGVNPARLVFARPDDASVVVVKAPAGDASGLEGAPLDTAAAPSATLGPPFPVMSAPAPALASQVPAPPVALPPAAPGAPAAAPAVAEPAASFAVTERDATTRPGSAIVGFALVLVAALAVMARNRRMRLGRLPATPETT